MAVSVRDPKSTFIHIPKCAGSSVRKWMLANIVDAKDERPNPHRTYDQLEKDLGTLGFTFCIVRNPFERAVSGYQYKLQKVGNKFRKQFPTFESFLKHGKDKTMIEQWKYFEKVDLILRLETLRTDFHQIQEFYSKFEPLPHSNKSNHDHWKTYYNDKCRELVEKRFVKDLELLGYSYDDNN